MSWKKNITVIITLLLLGIAIGCDENDDGNIVPDDPRSKFLGTWKVNESCTRSNYTVSISTDPGNTQQVLLNNFCNTGPGYDPAVGLVVNSTIKVASQNIGEGWTVNGEGIYQADGTIDWAYTIVISGTTESCMAEYSY